MYPAKKKAASPGEDGFLFKGRFSDLSTRYSPHRCPERGANNERLYNADKAFECYCHSVSLESWGYGP